MCRSQRVGDSMEGMGNGIQKFPERITEGGAEKRHEEIHSVSRKHFVTSLKAV